jgi:putative MATE family efflux protein
MSFDGDSPSLQDKNENDGAVPSSLSPTAPSGASADTANNSHSHGPPELLPFSTTLLLTLKNSIPSACRMMFLFLSQNISLAYVGRYLPGDQMAGISAGLTFLWMIGIFPCMGISCAADTLCAQEYGRQKDSTKLGVYARRGIIVNLLYAIPVFLVAINSKAILTAMFDATMSRYASEWLKYSVLYLFPQGCMIIMAKFAETQLLPGVPMLAQIIASALTPVISKALIAPYGLTGACLTLAAVSWIQLALVLFLVYRSPTLRHTWGWASSSWKDIKADIKIVFEFQGMKRYLSLAVPSMLFLGMEGAAFNGTSMVAALLGPVQCAAWTILLQLQAFGWSTTYGTTTGVGVRIGNALGALQPKQAKRYANSSIGLVFCLSAINCCIFLIFMPHILSLFTNDPAIAHEMKTIAIFVPLMHISDCVQFVFQGIYAGAGMNHIGAPILLFFLWIIGLPLAIFLSLHQRMGILGILIGMSVAMAVEIPVFILIQTRKFEWEELARNAAKHHSIAGSGAEGDGSDDLTAAVGGIVVVGGAVEVSTGDLVASLQQLNVFSTATAHQQYIQAEERHQKEQRELTEQFTKRIDALQAEVASQKDAIQELTRQMKEYLLPNTSNPKAGGQKNEEQDRCGIGNDPHEA